jgi:SAM-dependent methyltransferase
MTKAAEFDRQVTRFEKLRDGNDDFRELRQALLSGIRGDVLEIAPGPGFNFPFYTNITSLTAVDLSPKMTASAQAAWERTSNTPGTFITTDILEADFADNSFDSIVSTCSLCAYSDPVAVLNKLGAWCKPEGTIYLLEHGLSDYWLMRTAQRLYEPIHYKIHACHCNRDISEILKQSDLNIVSIKKPKRYAVIDFMYSIVAEP